MLEQRFLWNCNANRKEWNIKISWIYEVSHTLFMPYIIYTDFESLIKKIDGYASNPENSSTTKIGEHITCRYVNNLEI